MIGTGLWRNPILSREIDHRMRDNRTYFVPVVYISVLGLVTLGIYLAMGGMADVGPSNFIQGWEIGQFIFKAVTFTQMGLILMLVPSVAAGAITSERDKGTLVPLLVTPMKRGRITIGKLVAPVLYVLLLLSTSLPFAALSFGFGGTDMKMLAIAYGCMVSTTLYVASLGLLVSTVMKRTVPAVLLAYGLVAAIVIGSIIAEVIVHIAFEDLDSIIFLYLNPFAPLVFADDGTLVNEVNAHWWITPAIQVVLGGLFLSIAHLRIRNMRS
jgi:ABC-2 type transport system permease protein